MICFLVSQRRLNTAEEEVVLRGTDRSGRREITKEWESIEQCWGDFERDVTGKRRGRRQKRIREICTAAFIGGGYCLL